MILPLKRKCRKMTALIITGDVDHKLQCPNDDRGSHPDDLSVSVTHILEVCFFDTVHIPSLQRRHNDRDGVSNHLRLDCLLNRLFGCISKKTSKLRVTGLCEGNSPVVDEFPSQGPVTRKMLPFDDIIMMIALCQGSNPERCGYRGPVLDKNKTQRRRAMHNSLYVL